MADGPTEDGGALHCGRCAWHETDPLTRRHYCRHVRAVVHKGFFASNNACGRLIGRTDGTPDWCPVLAAMKR